MRFDKLTLCNMQINHRCGDVGMSQKIFECDDIKPLFEQMRSIRMTQRMQVDILGNGSFFEILTHHSRESPHTVPSIGFFSVK